MGVGGSEELLGSSPFSLGSPAFAAGIAPEHREVEEGVLRLINSGEQDGGGILENLRNRVNARSNCTRELEVIKRL